MTVFFDRVARVYDFLIRRVIFNIFKVFSERFARYGQTVPFRRPSANKSFMRGCMPPISINSLIAYCPAGRISARTGTRFPILLKSSSSSLIPAAWAIPKGVGLHLLILQVQWTLLWHSRKILWIDILGLIPNLIRLRTAIPAFLLSIFFASLTAFELNYLVEKARELPLPRPSCLQCTFRRRIPDQVSLLIRPL